ncbi:MAG: RNA-processing protein [Candidatus Diapherotrites archaeon]|nr:RNA-processing protein [Candidatus Diapherotrites archaeon]
MTDVDEFLVDEGGLEEEVRIPRERVGVLIGKKGKTRKRLERIADVKINVDSKTGEVRIRGSKETDPLTFMRMVKVVKAIGRGFDPDTALKLLQDDYYLEVINLKEHLGRKAIQRQKARLIGTGGSARKRLEALTDTDIRIYGHTVSIIGDYESVSLAKRAIRRLALEGSPHSVVFRELEMERKRKKTEKLLRELGIISDEEE